MNLIDMNVNDITMCIEGKDIEMKHAICYGKVFDSWLVSKCGKIWSIPKNSLLTGALSGSKRNYVKVGIRTDESFWEDGSGNCQLSDRRKKNVLRNIGLHKIVMDTWAPLYDNSPEGLVWEEWEKVRDLPTVYNYISKTVVIDHIDDDPTNNHIDNLRRVTQWDNNHTRKKKGI